MPEDSGSHDPRQQSDTEDARIRRVQAAERFELVGQLAESVSHDLNNALGVITTYSNLLMSEVEPGGQEYEDLEAIFQAARRAGELTRWLNLFSQDPEGARPRYIPLAEALRTIEKVAGKFVEQGGLDLVVTPDDGTDPVDLPSTRIEDLLFGMLAEARYGLESGDVELRSESDPVAARGRVHLLARGATSPPGARSDLSFLAPGPGDHGSEAALASLSGLAERFGGKLTREPTEGGFDLLLDLPLRAQSTDPVTA